MHFISYTLLIHTRRLSCSLQKLNLQGTRCASQNRECSRNMAGVKTVYNDIKKSQEDKRDYRGLLLDNQMKVLLISDPTTDKSSAALQVGVGNMCDPPELPGLAHFCEHMLFLGTSKYPDEQEYKRYLSENGGACNASTSSQVTTYFFDVAPEGLQGALDRFAQFFIAPLFTESATEREVNAVNSENEKNIKIDSRRLLQVEKSTYDQAHPYSHFGTGSFDTLMTRPREAGIDTRQALLDFHSRYYSANIMTLAVLGKETLDELQTFVTDLFTSVVNKDVVVKDWEGHPLGDKQVKQQLTVVPVKNLRSLRIQWPLPDLHEHYKMKPGSYFSHLLGHEGPGSIYSEIKNLGWATGLSAGSSRFDGFGFFKVSVDLSEEGLDHTTDIVTLVFQYIKMLKQHGPQQWIQEEKKELNAMQFRFKDKEQPRNYTVGSTSDLRDYPIPEVLCGDYLIEEYDPDVISKLLNHLRPDNCRIITSAKKFEGQTDETEIRYGVQYTNQPMDENLIETWTNCTLHPNLQLPVKNEFISSNFDLVKQVDKVQQSEEDKIQQKQEPESQQPLVDEAMSFIDQVKLKYGNQTQVYTDLLDIMRGLKTHTLSPQDAVVGMCNLFKGYPGLIGGFGRFLPPGYKIEVENDESVQLQQPGGDVVSLSRDELGQVRTNNMQVDKPNTPSLEPRLVEKTELMELWHRQDDEFLLPKACVSVSFISPEVYKSVESMNLTSMLERLFVDSLNEYLYAAELAGLHYDFITLRNGFKVTLDGYNDKLGVLLQKVLDRLVNMKVDPDRFSVLKEKYIRGLQNYEAEQPYTHSSYYTDVFLTEVMWTKKEKLAQAPDMTVSDLQAYIPKLLRTLYLKMLVYGNVDKEGAVRLGNVITSTLEKGGTTPLPSHLQPQSQAVHLPEGTWFGLRVENSVHATNALKVYYQVGMESIRDNILLELLAQINKQPCFDTLRTKEQLGYIVFSGVTRHYGVQGFYVTVQSTRSPHFLETRVENYLESLQKQLIDMSEDVFIKHQNALASRRLEKAKNMRQQNGRYMSEISSDFYFFNRDEEEVSYLKTVTKDQVIRFFEKYIVAGSPQRRKLSVYIPSATGSEVHGDGNNSEPTTLRPSTIYDMESLATVKKTLDVYPRRIITLVNLLSQSKIGTNAEQVFSTQSKI